MKYSILFFVLLILLGCRTDGSDSDMENINQFQGQAILGPLAGATVEVFRVGDVQDGPIYTTKTVDSNDLDQAGIFSVSEDILASGELYLLKVSGGVDIDYDDDGISDSDPILNNGALHGVFTLEQIRRGGYNVSILTELIYQRLRFMIDADSPTELLKAEIDRIAQILLKKDVDGDGGIDADDAAAWHPRLHRENLRHSPGKYRSLISSIHEGKDIRSDAIAVTDSTICPLKWHTADTVAVSGNIAYVFGLVDMDSHYGLRIIDISFPDNLKIIGSLDIPDGARDIVVQDGIAYLALNYKGLLLVDVNNPTAPTPLGSIDTPGETWAVFVSGKTAYVTDSYDGIQLIDVSDPTNPRLVHSLGYGNQVAVSGNIAYVSGQWCEGVRVIDISNPSNPQILTSISNSPNIKTLTIVGNILYIYGVDLKLYDVSKPLKPKLIGSVYISNYGPGSESPNIMVSDDIAYLSNNYDGIRLIDVNDPANPTIIGTLGSASRGLDFAMADGIAYVAAEYDGLQIVASGRNAVVERTSMSVTSLDTTSFDTIYNLTVSDGIAYVAAGDLKIINFKDPSNPVIIGSIDEETYHEQAERVAVSGNIAYVGVDWICSSGMCFPNFYSGYLVIYDISDPANPVRLSEIDGRVSDIVAVGNMVFLITDEPSGFKFKVIDATDPANPILLESVNLPGSEEWTISSSIMFMAYNWLGQFGGSQAIDLSDPKNTSPLGSNADKQILNFGHPRVAVWNNTAYTPKGSEIAWKISDDVKIFDVSDPDNPINITFMDTPGYAYRVEVSDGVLYVADGFRGVQIYDLTDCNNPVRIGSVDTAFPATDVIVSEGVGYIIAENDFESYIITIPAKSR